MKDEQLIRQLCSSNEREKQRAEKYIWETYHHFVGAQALNPVLQNADERETCYNDAVLVVCEKVINGGFDARASIKTFLWKIFYYKCVDFARKKTTNKNKPNTTLVEIEKEATNFVDVVRSEISDILNSDYWEKIQKGLRLLKEKCVNLLSYRYMDDYSYEEIATIMNFNSAETVRRSISRCKEELIELINSPTRILS